MSKIQDCIAFVQAQMLALPGMRQAPEYPPAALANQFPFSVGYAKAGDTTVADGGSVKTLYSVVLEIHVGLKKMATTVQEAMRYNPEAVAPQLFSATNRTLGGNCDTFAGLRGTFGPLPTWGTKDPPTIGWRYELYGIKIHTST